MVQSPDEAHYRMIAHRILDGAVVPFLGAGVNLCGRPDSVSWAVGRYLPSGSELAAYLAQRADYPFEDTTNLLRVSQYFEVMLGDGPLYQELHDVFDADYAPTPVHRLLAQLPAMIRARVSAKPCRFPLIVTPNYDDALEQAFREAGEPYDLVVYLAEDPDRGRFLHSSPDGQSRVIPVPNTYNELRFDERPVIAKIHGAVGRGVEQRDSFVITENDYIDYLRYTDLAQLIPATVVSRMKRSHFLFLGYRLQDWNLRVILNRLRDAGVSWNSWAVQPEPDGIEERFWNRRNVELLDARLEPYVGGLAAALLDASTTTKAAS
jgi:SIR2-like protein